MDGLPVPSGAFGFDINDLITTEAIAGIEIYRSSLTRVTHAAAGPEFSAVRERRSEEIRT